MATPHQKLGVLLINLGTPDAPTTPAVRRYLREFLSDERVIDIPRLGRWLLLNLIILPTRPRTSAKAYQKIWKPEGSPLLLHSRALEAALRERLAGKFTVELGMRYGTPSIASALERLDAAKVSRIIVAPLYPQYSASATATALAKVFEDAAARWDISAFTTLGSFYDDPRFIQACAAVARPHLERFQPDFVLMSYHGLPERQVRKSDPSHGPCLATEHCCDTIDATNHRCYRAQCFATTRSLREVLEIPADRCATSFQSRLGRTPWIRPFTDVTLERLYEQGVRRIAVLCPAFVADCLETIEEIGIRGREQWHALGGEELELIPCLNSHPRWVAALAEMLEELAS